MDNQSAKKRVLVLFGGRADEHSISCISAGSLLRAIDLDKFEPVPVGITKDGEWILPKADPRDWSLANGTMPVLKHEDAAADVVIDFAQGADGFFASPISDDEAVELEWLGHIDAVFPVMHGIGGEDGAVQGMFETLGIPYVGCGIFASAACMDKHFTKTLLAAAGIPVAPGITIDARLYDAASHFEANRAQLEEQIAKAGLTYPLFVKPAWGGSSFGVTKVDTPDELIPAVYAAYPHSWRILIEQGINAREIECAVLSLDPTKEPQTAWPGEIVLDYRASQDDAFYDFDAKYTDSAASHVEVPAKLPTETLKKVQDIARRALVAVDGTGLMRVDTFVQPDGSVMVNEINTMPGFTSISMYPKAWAASGIEYTDVITKLIESVAK